MGLGFRKQGCWSACMSLVEAAAGSGHAGGRWVLQVVADSAEVVTITLDRAGFKRMLGDECVHSVIVANMGKCARPQPSLRSSPQAQPPAWPCCAAVRPLRPCPARASFPSGFLPVSLPSGLAPSKEVETPPAHRARKSTRRRPTEPVGAGSSRIPSELAAAPVLPAADVFDGAPASAAPAAGAPAGAKAKVPHPAARTQPAPTCDACRTGAAAASPTGQCHAGACSLTYALLLLDVLRRSNRAFVRLLSQQ